MKLQIIEALKMKLKLFQQKKYKPIDKHQVLKWYHENASRNEAECYLKDKPFGTFLVRKSETHDDCYVLSMKVPIYANSTCHSHYLIECNKRKKYSLKGVQNKFTSVYSLVQYYSKKRDTLPVLLDLNCE